MRRKIRLVLRFAAVALLGVVTIALIAAAAVPELLKIPDAASFETPGKLALPSLPEGSVVRDSLGNQMGKLQGTENRIVVPLSEMSEELKATILAVEDADFYEHEGVSVKSIVRAIRANSTAGEVSQGGSTITQQLVKLSLVGNERSIARKVKEASLALQLEDQMCEDVSKKVCKDRLLQQYLNQIYLGQGTYGVEAASRAYFNKSAKDVNLAEAAMLAAVIRNPTGYDPINHPEVATDRREVALERMVDEGLINEEQSDFISSVPVPSQRFGRTAAIDSRSLSYMERKVRDELMEAEWLADTVEQRRYLIFNGGLNITTTIDPRAQALAEASAAKNPIERRDPRTEVALAAVEPSSGAIRAIVGEVVINGTPIEIADPVRGPRSGDGGFSSGSAFKPFTMIAALEKGYTINDTIRGDPAPEALKKKWGVTRPGSYPLDCPTKGQQTLAKHLARSNNCAFMRVQSSVGIDAVKQTAISLGISAESLDPLEDNAPCFTIGCGALVRPLDMASAYGTVANDGQRNPAHFVQRVEDRDGNVLFEAEAPNEQVISVQSARQATVAMEGVITGGTCSRYCRIPSGQEVAGKTGTTEVTGGANIGAWFVGYSPHLSAAVWVGDPLDQETALSSNPQGANTAGVIWQDFMSAYLEGTPLQDFTDPSPFSGGKKLPDKWDTTTSNRSGDGQSGDGGSDEPAGSTPGVAGGDEPVIVVED
jgi:penicillin-binding protein 1A